MALREISQTELFDAAPARLDLLAAQPDVSVMRPQGKRIGRSSRTSRLVGRGDYGFLRL